MKKEDYKVLKEKLSTNNTFASFDIPTDTGLLRRLDTPIIVGNTILQSLTLYPKGVLPGKTKIEIVKGLPSLPSYVEKTKQQIDEPRPNNPKVYLSDYSSPITDKDELRLTLGESTYWTSRAIEEAKNHIYNDIIIGKLHPFKLPLQMNCHLVIISADNKLALYRRSKIVQFEKLKWAASCGESMDAEKDCNTDGKFSPELTIRRALNEEAGIAEEKCEEAVIRFVGLGMEWHYLLYALMSVVELPTVSGKELMDSFNYSSFDLGEHSDFDMIDFTLEECLPLVLEGIHIKDNKKETKDELYGTARLGLLAALLDRYGFEKVVELI